MVRQGAVATCRAAPTLRSWRERGLAAAEVPTSATTSSGSARDFPILATRMNERPLVYLDTAASAQKPRAVIDTLKRFYEQDYANIHRGVYESEPARHGRTTRRAAQGAALPERRDWREIVFTRNATEGDQPRAASFLGRAPAGRRDPDHRDGAPRQHRALAARGRGDGCQGGSGPGDRRRRARLMAAFVERLSERTRCRGGVGLQRAGHGEPGHEIVRLAQAARPAGADRRRPGRAAPDRGRSGPGRRLPRLLRPQALRALGRRRPPRQGRAPGGDAPPTRAAAT